MDWDEIMKMKDPHEALKAMDRKVEAEDISLVEMEEMVLKYAKLRRITVDEMAFYPNGERVLNG